MFNVLALKQEAEEESCYKLIIEWDTQMSTTHSILDIFHNASIRGSIAISNGLHDNRQTSSPA